jgi:hypothetical protein
VAVRFVALCAGLALAACADNGIKPNPSPVAVAPQPQAARLRTGLAVRYWPFDVTEIGEVERLARSNGGQPGPVLPGLDFAENSGPVLTSTSKILMAVEITGFIRFPRGGSYAIAANSNDGVRVFVGGAVAAEDPDAHPMRQTPVAKITVEGDVWYPLRIVYFQRRGAWGLQLLWAPEGEPLAIVPASALMRTEN